MPLTSKKRAKKSQNQPRPDISRLTQNDAQTMYDSVKNQTQKESSSYWQILCQRFCSKNRKRRLEQKALARFNQQLDIRSLASVHQNLALLLSLLLSKEQALLFKYQQARTIHLTSSESESDKDSHQREKDIISEAAGLKIGRLPLLTLANYQDNEKKITKIEKAFSRLKNYQVKSDLDKQLIKGIYDLSKHRAVRKQSAASHEDSLQQLAVSDGSINRVSNNPLANSLTSLQHTQTMQDDQYTESASGAYYS